MKSLVENKMSIIVSGGKLVSGDFHLPISNKLGTYNVKHSYVKEILNVNCQNTG